MKVEAWTGTDDIAKVYIASMGNGRRVEFVESVQPPIPREEKWVLIVSTLFGCPVGCRICDAGQSYAGALSADEMMEQIDYMVDARYPGRRVPARKFKVQFARMGEPSFNPAVLDVLVRLPGRFEAPGLMPALSTIAPKGSESFFEKLLRIKDEFYGGRFQLQFSIHTTDPALRDWLMPVKKWSLEEIARYGDVFHRPGDRKVTLNFALGDGVTLEPSVLRRRFDPGKYLIKITPVNPTFSAVRNGIGSAVVPGMERYEVIEALENAGYEVILSIGEFEENRIGSNCGQYITGSREEETGIDGGYTYELRKI